MVCECKPCGEVYGRPLLRRCLLSYLHTRHHLVRTNRTKELGLETNRSVAGGPVVIIHKGNEKLRPSTGSSPSSEESDFCSSSSLSPSKEDKSLVWTELTVMSLRPSRSESSRKYSTG